MPRSPYPNTLPELYTRAFQLGGDTRAVTVGDLALTYAELDERSQAVARGLVDAGVEVGDRVAVFFSNRAETPIVDAGIARAGAVRVPLNPMYSAGQAAQIIEDAGVETVIADPTRARMLADREGPHQTDRQLFVFDESDIGYGRPFSALLDGNGRLDAEVPVDPSDPAAIYYTSGTTGRPKGVVYSHEGLVQNLLAHLATFDIGAEDRGLLTAPLSHSAGTFLWTGLLAGGEVVVQDGFEVSRVVEAIESLDITWTMAVPTMLYRLLDGGERVDAALQGLDRIYYGTAPMRATKVREAVERFGPNLVQFYGQTEVPNLITTFSARAHAEAVDAGNLERLRSAGKPALQVGLKLVDPETGDEQPVGEAGEVVVSAPYAFIEYHHRPDATAEVLRDGWVYTGDIGRLDEDGFLTLIDRKANMVTTGGMNVYTQEVEGVLATHPEVADVAVVGIPDEEWGEAIHAVVTPDGDSDLTEAEISAFLEDRLAGYKHPKSIEIRPALPRTSLGKIDRESIRQEFWAGQDRSIH